VAAAAAAMPASIALPTHCPPPPLRWQCCRH
jgi:hypothetical protein